jgi:hypothetical protein
MTMATKRIIELDEIVSESSVEEDHMVVVDRASGGTQKVSVDTFRDVIARDLPGGAGDVTGPGSSTDNAVVLFDGTDGDTIQDSLVTISDTGSITVPVGQTVDGRDVSEDGTDLDDHIDALNPHADSLDVAHEGAGGAVHANAVAAGAAGFMTGADKTKLDGIEAGAQSNGPFASLEENEGREFSDSDHGETIYVDDSSDCVFSCAGLSDGVVVTFIQAGVGQVEIQATGLATVLVAASFVAKTNELHSILVVRGNPSGDLHVSGDLEVAP